MAFIQYIIDNSDVFSFLQRKCLIETFSFEKEIFSLKVTDIPSFKRILKRFQLIAYR